MLKIRGPAHWYDKPMREVKDYEATGLDLSDLPSPRSGSSKDNEFGPERNEYMREYMRRYRASKRASQGEAVSA